MGFESIPYEPDGASFNSGLSCDFLDMYKSIERDRQQSARSRRSHRTFAPSSFKCDRISFFRIRGTEPDQDAHIDPSTEFLATIGKAVHEDVQRTLRDGLGADWLDVGEYLRSRGIEASTTRDADDLETKVEFLDPPVRFAVDGLLSLPRTDEPVLLEIKSCELSGFRSLGDVREYHRDQTMLYLHLLRLHTGLVLYRERTYGDMKCYQVRLNGGEEMRVSEKISHVLECVESNIVPDRLPKGDRTCQFCKYKTACAQWGD